MYAMQPWVVVHAAAVRHEDGVHHSSWVAPSFPFILGGMVGTSGSPSETRQHTGMPGLLCQGEPQQALVQCVALPYREHVIRDAKVVEPATSGA